MSKKRSNRARTMLRRIRPAKGMPRPYHRLKEMGYPDDAVRAAIRLGRRLDARRAVGLKSKRTLGNRLNENGYGVA